MSVENRIQFALKSIGRENRETGEVKMTKRKTDE